MTSYYIIEPVPTKYMPENTGDVWYCHLKGYSSIPVLGSIGDKKKAMRVCRLMNIDGRVRYK